MNQELHSKVVTTIPTEPAFYLSRTVCCRFYCLNVICFLHDMLMNKLSLVADQGFRYAFDVDNYLTG